MGDRKGAVYVRTSTADRQTSEQQLVALAEYCKRTGIEDEILIYTDNMSGLSNRRPEYNRLIDDILADKIGKVICWKLDRLGRNLRDLCEFLKILEKYNVEFISLMEGYDTTTSVGKLMFGVVGAFAEYERNIISERTKLKYLLIKAKGGRWGRPLGSKDKHRRRSDGYRRRYLQDKEKVNSLFSRNLTSKNSKSVGVNVL